MSRFHSELETLAKRSISRTYSMTSSNKRCVLWPPPATFAMFQEIAGDRIVSTYTRKDLSAFYDVLRSLPSLYAKDRRWRDLPLAEIGAASADDPMARLTMKTVI